MRKFVCIDVGGTFIKYGVINESGHILVKSKTNTDAKVVMGSGVLQKIKDIIKVYIKEYDISGICISTAGIIDSKMGKVVYASPDIMPDYTGINIKEEIEKTFDIRCEVENDVNCVGLSEIWLGEGKDASSAVCIALGTGIGGCIILDKKIVHGFNNSAGEIGYMNVNGKNIQDIASSSALVKNVCKLKNLSYDEIDGKKVFELAQKGDIDCISEIEKLVKNLCIGISNICYVINPQVVILGGGIMAQEYYLKPLIKKELKNIMVENIYNNTEIKFATRQNNSGMIGALYNFLQKEKSI